MLRISLIAALICSITISFAQDTTKKVHTVRPINKYKSYKYYPHRWHKAKKDTGAVKPGTKPAASAAIPARRDTTVLPAAPADKTLSGQYQFLLSRIYHYQQPLLASTWKSAIDTLNLNKRQLKDAQSKLAVQAKLIDSLKKEANDKAQSLNTSKAQVDEVNILGLTLSKTVYNLIVWGLVVLFGATAAIVIARSGGARHEAKYRTRLYEELEEDFKAYKSKANEKEKKLARELQTERNKVDELMGRG